MPDYDKPPELYEGLRLHQNENTGRLLAQGDSPRSPGSGPIRSVSTRRTRTRSTRVPATSASRPHGWR